MMNDFSGKTVMVTGAAGGIGQEMCRTFAGRGARIAALDRSDTVLEFAGSLANEGGRVSGEVADISREAEVKSAVDALVKAVGAIDILINNAGYSGASNLETTTSEIWHNDIEINLNGAYHCAAAVLPAMKEARSGAIVNIGSVNGTTSLGDPAYSAAKAGLISFTKALALEYGRFGIRANMISPGTVRTPIWDHRVKRNPEIFENLLKWYPLRRVAMPHDISNAAAFLASDLSNAISGAILPVDCGLSAGNIVMSREITMAEF